MNWGNIRATIYTYGGLFKIRTQIFELVPVFGKIELSPFEIKIRTYEFELNTVPCFSEMSPGTKFTFRGFNFESQRSFLFNNFFEIFLNFNRLGTISLFSTLNCQSDPEWNPETKLETQDLLAGSLHKI